MEAVSKRYADLKETVKHQGLNNFVFNAHLPVVRKNTFLKQTEKQQIKSLFDNKEAFSTGAQWCHVGLNLFGFEAVVAA